MAPRTAETFEPLEAHDDGRTRVGLQLKQLRVARDMTQEALAEASGLAVDTIRRIERGAFSPSLETLSRLTTALEISLTTLFLRVQGERSSEAEELWDFLQTRSKPELRLAQRVLRALFEARDGEDRRAAGRRAGMLRRGEDGSSGLDSDGA